MVLSVFAGTVALGTDVGAAAQGDVLYRANAGGSVTANGDTWDPLLDYMVAGDTTTTSHGQPGTIDSSVPAGTPSQIWETERWDAATGDEMQYEFAVPAGQQVEVRLYFYDGYSGTASAGDRVFDVSIDGATVLDDFDVIATYGDDTAAMESFTVTSDGTVDIDFGHVVENPQVNAIEIVSAEAQPGELGSTPSSLDFGTVVTGTSQTETVTLTNLGDPGDGSHPDVTVSDVSVSGADSGQFSTDFSGDVTLAPGESMDVQVTYSPSVAQAHAATMTVSHSGTNSPVTVDLSGEGTSSVPVGFSKSKLQGFSAGNPTAIDFGPDGRAYVSTQGGTVYALEVERTGEDSYQVVDQVQIDAIKDIPNHDDDGTYNSGETTRQITGLTVGGTASQPVVYVSSSDPTIKVGADDDSVDTNSGAISRLTLSWNGDGTLASLDHDVMVMGLPRSEENHATNGLALTDDESTLYVAQGGHTNKGAPGNNFGHTPEYALSAAVLQIDLAQIESDYEGKSLQSYDGNYPDLPFYYAIPTVQNDDATDGDDLPFGGDDGLNQAKIVPGGPVQVYSPGYRNPYDLVLAESGQLYVIDNGPNGGWGGQPADSSGNIVESACTNHPNEDGSYGTGDQLHLATEGSYGGHANPIRANPDGAGLFDASGTQYHDFDSSDSPVPFSMANPVECDYQDSGEDNSIGPTFGWSGGITEYTASNFGGEMQGDLLVVENANTIKRVQLNAAGDGVIDVSSPFNTPGALGITAQDDDEIFPGTIWTANHGGNDVTVFEPNDFDGGGSEQCTGADDPSLDEDGDGYDNADEIDAGSDPCSSASTPADFDGDGTSNVNDLDDDDDGIDDTQDPFAVDASNGLANDLPATYEFAPNSEPGTILDLGFTGVMMNGQDYADLYDPNEVTAGGAANVLTVENVGQGDAHQSTNTQTHAYQVGVNADEPFTVVSTVNGLPSDAEPFQSQGVFVGTGDQDNYVKLTVTGFSAEGGSGVQFATEEGGSFTDVAKPSAPTAGNTTTLSMTVYPANGTVLAYYTVAGGEQQFVGETTVPTSWFDTTDGDGTAVGVVATSNGASSTFDATWQNLSVEPLQTPENQPPTADAGPDQTVDEGTAVQLDASGSGDPDGDLPGYTWTQTAGTPVSLSANDAVDPTFTAPEVDADETLTFQLTVSDGVDSDTDTVSVTVQDTDTGTSGDVVFAVNSGGPEYTAADGTVYVADTNFVSGSTYGTSNWASTPPEIVNTADDTLYQTERYGDPFGYDVPVEDGTYEVTLQFAEIYQGAAPSDTVDSAGPSDGTNENDRLFNASIEGEQVLTNYDIFADVGPLNATTRTYTVEVTDGQLDVDFEATYDNAKISAIRVEQLSQSTMSLEEAVASADDGGDDTTVEFTEVQMAINWWQNGDEVPNTGGETIGFAEMQDLINLWQTGATVGDGGQEPTTGSALVEITPGSGLETTTYGQGSYQVTNTGEKNIASVSFDLSTASYPDMVFDPDGTAGDPTGEGLNIFSDGGTGITTAEGGSEAFSQPHNGVDGDDGYDVMTVEFGNFDPGETATFWADNDPTSIKSSTIGSQEAGPVSGLELAGSTVTVTYEDGTTQTTQLMGDGSAGGSTATVTDDEAPAPTLGADGVALDESVLDARHSAATVSSAGQAVTITGEPGATVTLVRVEGELTLSNVPDADGSGEPGYEIEAYEANSAENVEYYTTTLDSNGEGTVPVTLTDTDSDGDDNAGYNYFTAVHGVPSSDAVLTSNVVVLKLEETATTPPGDVVVAVNAGGSEHTTGEGVTYSGDQSGFSGNSQFSTADAIAGTDEDALYQSEVYGGAPGEPSMWWNASVPNGDYVVTLHFAEIFQASAGERVFDVDVEGTKMLDDYDVYADVGHDEAVTKTATVTVTDGELNVEFDASVDNAKVSAITVESATDGGSGSITGSADVAVTENAGIDASTYGGGSFQITNTGDQAITAVSFDLSPGTFTDVVFDPDGTAGDAGAKGFTVSNGVGGTTTGTFAQPHNGVDGDDGYDALDVSFTDFQPGETFSFAVDIDPTSIKGGGSTGAAGSVSGLELGRSTVTVEYADGSTQTTQLFGDGSGGGSQATAKDDPAAAPTLGVGGVALDGGALDAQHSAATVSSASQTITVTGEPGATVQLLHVEGQLELFDTAGYDVESYEANTAEQVSYHTVTLDSNGEATVAVTLTNTSASGAEGGFNYFVATVQDGSGDTGQLSNVVILKLESSG